MELGRRRADAELVVVSATVAGCADVWQHFAVATTVGAGFGTALVCVAVKRRAGAVAHFPVAQCGGARFVGQRGVVRS